MKSKEKYFIFIFLVIIIGIVVYRFKDYIVDKNFTINVTTNCSKDDKNCFSSVCTVGVDLGCDKTPYKKVGIVASEAPKCLEEHTCENFTCNQTSNKCSISYCSQDTLEAGEVCISD